MVFTICGNSLSVSPSISTQPPFIQDFNFNLVRLWFLELLKWDYLLSETVLFLFLATRKKDMGYMLSKFLYPYLRTLFMVLIVVLSVGIMGARHGHTTGVRHGTHGHSGHAPLSLTWYCASTVTSGWRQNHWYSGITPLRPRGSSLKSGQYQVSHWEQIHWEPLFLQGWPLCHIKRNNFLEIFKNQNLIIMFISIFQLVSSHDHLN